MLFHQRMIMLQIVDTQWKDHLYSLDHLKEGIGLRGYGQRDPLVEYKKESFQMFQALMDRIDEEILRWSFLYQPVATPEAAPEPPRRAEARGAGPAPAREREPELALAGVKTVPRNLTFNDPSATPTAFARAARSRGRPRAARTRCRPSAARGRRSAATTPAPAAAARSTRSAMGARAGGHDRGDG